jgi:hypothetical protein
MMCITRNTVTDFQVWLRLRILKACLVKLKAESIYRGCDYPNQRGSDVYFGF